jgi:hypothetical protein
LDEVAVPGFGPGSDVLSNRILVTYHAILVRRAIEMDPDKGLVSPTNVVIHADGEMTDVQVLDAVIMADRTRNPALEAIIIDARMPLERGIRMFRAYGTLADPVQLMGSGSDRVGSVV